MDFRPRIDRLDRLDRLDRPHFPESRPFLDPFWTLFGPLSDHFLTNTGYRYTCLWPDSAQDPPRRGPRISPKRGPKRTLPNREVLPPKMTLFGQFWVKNRRISGKKALLSLIPFFTLKENPRSPCVSKRKPHCISARARGKSLGYPFFDHFLTHFWAPPAKPWNNRIHFNGSPCALPTQLIHSHSRPLK